MKTNSMAASSILVATLLCLYCMLSSSWAQPTGTKCPPVPGPSCACQPPDGVGVLDLSKFGSQSGNPTSVRNQLRGSTSCIVYNHYRACPVYSITMVKVTVIIIDRIIYLYKKAACKSVITVTDVLRSRAPCQV